MHRAQINGRFSNSLPSAKLQSLRADAATVDDPNGDSFLYEAVG